MSLYYDGVTTLFGIVSYIFRQDVHSQSPEIFVFVPEVFVFPVRISLSYVELYISISYKLFNGYPFGNAIRNFSSHCFEKLHVNVIF